MSIIVRIRKINGSLKKIHVIKTDFKINNHLGIILKLTKIYCISAQDTFHSSQNHISHNIYLKINNVDTIPSLKWNKPACLLFQSHIFELIICDNDLLLLSFFFTNILLSIFSFLTGTVTEGNRKAEILN